MTGGRARTRIERCPDGYTQRVDLPPAGVSSPHPAARQRPFPVLILAGIQLLSALFFGAAAAFIAWSPGAGKPLLEALERFGLRSGFLAGSEDQLFALLFGGVAVIYALVAVALIRMRREGWTAAMLLTGGALALQIYTWWANGELVELAMLLNVVTVFYLNQRQVRHAFGISRSRLTASLESTRG
jgi:hypothetical protein